MTYFWFIVGVFVAIPCQQLTSQYVVEGLCRTRPRLGNEVACALGLLAHLFLGAA